MKYSELRIEKSRLGKLRSGHKRMLRACREREAQIEALEAKVALLQQAEDDK